MDRRKNKEPNVVGMKEKDATKRSVYPITRKGYVKATTKTIANMKKTVKTVTQKKNAHLGPAAIAKNGTSVT